MFTALLVLAMAQGNDCCASMNGLAADGTFQAAHLSPLALQWKPKYGKMGTFKVGYRDVRVFVVPPARRTGAGVILIHEWWGLNDYIKREAERLHQATGWGVAALDLYGGKTATDAETAAKMMQAVDPKVARETVRVASGQIKRGTLLGRRLKKVGTLGFCFGGGWSLQAAIAGGKDVDACVMYYGMPELDAAKLAPLRAPVLGVFAQRDTFFTPAMVDQFSAAMKKAGKSLTLKTYDAVHAFANPSNPQHDKAKADAAWRETLAFLRKYLRLQ